MHDFHFSYITKLKKKTFHANELKKIKITSKIIFLWKLKRNYVLLKVNTPTPISLPN